MAEPRVGSVEEPVKSEPTLKEWTSKITDVRPNHLETHGLNQVEIIKTFSYEEMVFFLLMGRRPSSAEREMLRALIVSHISHGITNQSTLAVRMAADTRSDFLHAAIAGFSTGAGIYHLGGLQAATLEIRALADIPDSDLEGHLLARLAKGERIIGFGHRFHKRTDPRAQTLMTIAHELQFTGRYVRTARRVESVLQGCKKLAMNIEAASGAILLDLGFDASVAHLIIIIGRSPMFAAAYLERLAEHRAPFQKIEVFDLVGE